MTQCVHFIYKDKFTDPYIKMMEKHFNKENHFFYIYGNPSLRYEPVEKENVIYYRHVSEFFIKNINIIDNCDLIIAHSFFSKELIVNLFIRRRLIKKLNIFFWGGDIYSHRSINIRDMIYPILKKNIIKNAPFITTLVDGDYDLVRDYYSAQGKNLRGIYIFNEELKARIFELVNKNRMHKGINIQIGNSATESNCHMEILDLLSKYKDEDISIYVPLSYGNVDYRNMVMEKGYSMFKDKFKPLLEFMPQEEYFSHLNSIDVAIFNNNRQQATENIETLLYLGAKVYINSNTTMAQYYFEELEMKMYEVKDIYNMDFHDLYYVNEECTLNNRMKLDKLWSDGTFVSSWERIFERGC